MAALLSRSTGNFPVSPGISNVIRHFFSASVLSCPTNCKICCPTRIGPLNSPGFTTGRVIRPISCSFQKFEISARQHEHGQLVLVGGLPKLFITEFYSLKSERAGSCRPPSFN